MIKSSKTELDLISKNIICKIIHRILDASYNNIWKDSSDTINWFHKIKYKNKANFIQLDIDFYSSIFKDLLLIRLNAANNYEHEVEVSLASRKPLLSNNNST